MAALKVWSSWKPKSAAAKCDGCIHYNSDCLLFYFFIDRFVPEMPIAGG